MKRQKSSKIFIFYFSIFQGDFQYGDEISLALEQKAPLFENDYTHFFFLKEKVTKRIKKPAVLSLWLFFGGWLRVRRLHKQTFTRRLVKVFCDGRR
jgi:hypothetical protein